MITKQDLELADQAAEDLAEELQWRSVEIKARNHEKAEPPSTGKYPLFKHMLDEHNLVLLDSELNEIMRIAKLCK